jgi:hypothetical protein
MKQLVAILLFVAVASTKAVCASNYEPGQTLFVWAKSGLKLRAEADPQAKVLSVLPDGAKVVVQPDKNSGTPFSVQVEPAQTVGGTKYPGMQLEGFWVLVKYKEQVGYVFDQYLSRLPTMAVGLSYIEDQSLVSVLKKKSSLVKLIEKTDTVAYGYILLTKTHLFSDGSFVKTTQSEKGWWRHTVITEGCSLKDGYLIFDRLYQHDNRPAYHLLEKRPGYLRFEIEMGELEIYEVQGMLILYESHSC